MAELRDSIVLVIRQTPPHMPAHRQPYNIMAASFVFINVIAALAIQHRRKHRKHAAPTPHHNSRFRGEEWVQELLNGHPNHIKSQLGMEADIFRKLVADLKSCGLAPSIHLSCEEQVALFLYACITSLSIRHLGEHFQHANSTISK